MSDPIDKLSMPASALAALAKAVPTDVLQDIIPDNCPRTAPANTARGAGRPRLRQRISWTLWSSVSGRPRLRGSSYFTFVELSTTRKRMSINPTTRIASSREKLSTMWWCEKASQAKAEYDQCHGQQEGCEARSFSRGWVSRASEGAWNWNWPFSLSLAKSQPEKSETTSDNEGDPAHPHRYRPVSDDDGPVHNNPRQVGQRDYGEDHSSHKRKRFCVHEPSSQVSNSG